MSFLPFFIFIMLRTKRAENRYPYFFMTFMIIILLFTNHRMFLIAFPILVMSYLFAFFASNNKSIFLRVKPIFSYILLFIFLLLLIASLFQISYLTILKINMYHNWGRDWLSHSVFLPVNLFIDYSLQRYFFQLFFYYLYL